MPAGEVEHLKRFAPAITVDLAPTAGGAVMREKSVRDLLVALTFIEQKDGVGPSRGAMFLKPFPGDAGQLRPFVLREKTALDQATNESKHTWSSTPYGSSRSQDIQSVRVIEPTRINHITNHAWGDIASSQLWPTTVRMQLLHICWIFP